MKKHIFLTAALAATVLSGGKAMAQLNYQNGDLLAGFYTAGGAHEVIVDLGSIANMQAYSWSTSVNLSSVLSSVFGSTAAGINWTVFGINDQTVPYNSSVTQSDPNTIWASLARGNPAVPNSPPHVVGSSTSQANIVSDVGNIVLASDPNSWPVATINNLGAGIVEVSTANNGVWYSMYNGGQFTGNMVGDLTWNSVNTGVGTSDLFQSNPGNHNTAYATDLGSISLSSAGVLTIGTVPEPSTWAMFGSGMLALFAIRRRK